MRVAIEEGLENVRRAIEAKGWQTVPLRPDTIRSADAVVLTGMDDDLFGDETIRTQVPVIAATGLSAAEIVRRLSEEPAR